MLFEWGWVRKKRGRKTKNLCLRGVGNMNRWTWTPPPAIISLVPAPQGRSITASRALFCSFLFTFSTFIPPLHFLPSHEISTFSLNWLFCYYWTSFFQVVGNLKSSNRKLAFSWLQMSGLQTFQKFDKTALRCLLQHCLMLAFLNRIEVILILEYFISSSNIDLSRSKECVHPRQHFPKRYL